ncbi:MAG: IS607 family transposase [Clostridia bacterium]|jgi:predicted site-specific integrase-resolvase
MRKLSQYAKDHGIVYRTAYNHFKKGLIKGAFQLETGTIVIPDDWSKPSGCEYTITYARVSSSENKDSLERQSKRLADFCIANGWQVNEQIKEIGSGLNDKRPKLLSILEKRKASRLVIEHKDRLARFGVEYIRQCCEAFGCDLIIINTVEEDKDRLIEDFVSIITSFCAKIYGHRRNKRKTEELIRNLSHD